MLNSNKKPTRKISTSVFEYKKEMNKEKTTSFKKLHQEKFDKALV